MKQSVAISVCCPVYNGERFLAEALASVHTQRFTAWECICVDDGSRDGSQAICAEQARADGRFRVICQRNRGIGATRNRALEAVRGEAFIHIDADDLLLEHALEALWRAREESGAQLVVGRMVPFTKAQPEAIPERQAGELLEGEAWAREVVTAIQNAYSGRVPFPSWNKLYDRAFFGQMRFLPGRYADDTYWTPTTHFAVSRAYLLGEVTYAWRRGHTSASSKTCNAAWLEAHLQAFTAMAAQQVPASVRQAYSRAILQHGKWMMRVVLWSYLFHPGEVAEAEIAHFAKGLLRAAIRWPFLPRLRLWLLAHRQRTLLYLTSLRQARKA